jgi:hypothetical protein
MRSGGGRAAAPRISLLLLAASALLPARATPSNSPPPERGPTARERNAAAVENALRPCFRDAIDSGTFELIEIAFSYDTGEQPRPTIKNKRPSIGRPLYWCVERALAKVRLRATPGESYRYTQQFALGEIAPLPKEFLPVWQRALPDPARVRRALGAWLQPEVEVTSAGCLHVAGPEVLAEPFLDWRPTPNEGPGFFLHNGETVSPLPGDWWLRQRKRHTNADTYSDRDLDDPRTDVLVDDEFCLEHVDPVVSTLYRADHRLHDAVKSRAIFDAEWVVAGQGGVAGDIGFCLAVPPDVYQWSPFTPEEAEGFRRDVEGLIRGLDYGRPGSSRLLRIRYDPALGLTVRGVAPTSRPLDIATSAVETKCDRRAVLQCARVGKANEPSFESVAPLRKCLRESGANDQTISARFDITPDGAVANVNVETTYEDPGRMVPACVRQTFAGLAFPRSEGGSCPQSTRLHEIIWPRINQPD